jgi:hypothetical protein
VSGTFLTFPLCLLATNDEPEEGRLRIILAHAVERAGAGSDISDERVTQEEVWGFDTDNTRHKNIVRGAIVIGVKIGNVQSTASNCVKADHLIDQMHRKYGPDPLVFISTELFWGCHDRDEPTYREFSTLCAVNSVVGFKKFPVIVRREMIIARRLGFKSTLVMKSELRKRAKKDKLTVRQVRDTLDRLESRDLIVRCQASRRNVYFGNPSVLTADELRDYVKKIVEGKARVKQRRDIDRATFEGQNRSTTRPPEGHLKKGGDQNTTRTGPLRGPQQGPQRGPL